MSDKPASNRGLLQISNKGIIPGVAYKHTEDLNIRNPKKPFL
jgi:hypothetical protein